MTDYSKLIHDYLAGELSREDEAQLFEGLSRHPEWREEMQLQLQMERAMEKDIRSIAVPTRAASAVFASLGFRRPSKWSRYRHTASMISTWSGPRILLAGISGMVLLAAAYVVFRAPTVERQPQTEQIASAREIALPPSSHGLSTNRAPSLAEGIADAPSAIPAPVPRSKTIASTIPKTAQPAVPSPFAKRIPSPSFVPDEPLRYYSDIGNLYSVHYFTPQMMIGVSYAGQIFFSEDSGHSWALQHTGVSCDLYGIHFSDRAHGLAVGAAGTILRTSDGGTSWHIVPSGTKTTLSTVRLITPDTAYICGDNGTMLRSTTGGSSWEWLSTGVHANLFRMAFTNGMVGDVYGSNDLHIATTDGGKTWNRIK